MNLERLANLPSFRFRLSRAQFCALYELVRPALEPVRWTNRAVPPMVRFAVTMEYMATGTFYRQIGDIFGISRPSMSRFVKRTIEALADSVRSLEYNHMQMHTQRLNTLLIIITRPRVGKVSYEASIAGCTLHMAPARCRACRRMEPHRGVPRLHGCRRRHSYHDTSTTW